MSYKRLTREIAVPAGGGSMTFWTSYNTEAGWDHLFVEARTAGGDDWTTLPDANGHTTQDTGDSCAEGWVELHPQLDALPDLGRRGDLYVDRHDRRVERRQRELRVAGSSGASTCRSGPERPVEVSIAYASDWATQGLGVFVDDVVLPDGTSTSFETGLDGWEITGPPEGSGANANNWSAPTPAASRSARRSQRPTRS